MKVMDSSSLVNHLLSHQNMQDNLSVPGLVEKVLARNEGVLTATGAVRATTGAYTGRSPQDKFIVRDDVSNNLVDWGPVNKGMNEESFERLFAKVIKHLTQQDELFKFNGYAGADKDYQLPIQVINEFAWQNLFSKQLFVRATNEELKTHQPKFTVISAPTFKANPTVDHTNSEAFVLISFKQKIVLIGGTEYAGEIKKSIFSVMNFLLPQQNILPMHCSANVGTEGDVALFFGLSGTGKTTLSADAYRDLIGDDEHGWSPNGVFNIEGGCYAKCINLSVDKEPQIFNAIRFGSVLENVMVDNQTRLPDYDNLALTENTRAAYPLNNIDNIISPSVAGHPNTIIFLTADASGTLPPISKLSKEQAMYHFLSGYTSKLAGTERGVTKPEATFSTCFGAPFLPLPPATYAEMLGDKIEQHDSNVFLVNTGWTGGPYGVGHRMKLSYTRAMVHAALEGELNNIDTVTDDIFGLNIPRHIPGVPDHLLVPQHTWHDQKAYQQAAQNLAMKFHDNFKKFSYIDEAIQDAGPLFRPEST